MAQFRHFHARILSTLLCVMSCAAVDLCRQLSDLNGVNEEFLNAVGYDVASDGQYFCGVDAPQQLKCSCGAAGICVTQLDPWGRNIGECGCCPLWVWSVLVVFGILLTLSLLVVLYACCCRGKWWFDGYPQPIQPILPRRGPPTVVPAGLPLPQSLFRGYRISDFVSDPPPRTGDNSNTDRIGGNPARGTTEQRLRQRGAARSPPTASPLGVVPRLGAPPPVSGPPRRNQPVTSSTDESNPATGTATSSGGEEPPFQMVRRSPVPAHDASPHSLISGEPLAADRSPSAQIAASLIRTPSRTDGSSATPATGTAAANVNRSADLHSIDISML